MPKYTQPQKIELYARIVDLMNKGNSQRQIAATLGITTSWMKPAKEWACQVLGVADVDAWNPVKATYTDIQTLKAAAMPGVEADAAAVSMVAELFREEEQEFYEEEEEEEEEEEQDAGYTREEALATTCPEGSWFRWCVANYQPFTKGRVYQGHNESDEDFAASLKASAMRALHQYGKMMEFQIARVCNMEHDRATMRNILASNAEFAQTASGDWILA